MSETTRIGVGLDFGTSNSTAAWFDGRELHHVRLEHGGPVSPTAVHLDRGYLSLTGSEAVTRYVEENRGRRVELVAEVIGEAATSISEGTSRTSELETKRRVVYGPLEDRGLPGRLFLGLKRLLGDPQLRRLRVFERHFRLVALVTPILLRIREQIEAQTGAPVERLHAGRPVNFEGARHDANATALARLTEAYGYAGFGALQFYPEPVAATLSYLWRARPPRDGVALTVDFGGGTLDLSLLRYAGQGFEVLATDGVGLGGDRIDQLIFAHCLFPLLGKGESESRVVDGRRVDTLFPFEQFESALLNWPITHTLNQLRTKTLVAERLSKGGSGVEKFERLNDLITYNYSYNCFQAIRVAKAALSQTEATIIDIPELNLVIPFTRVQLDAILSDALRMMEELIDRLLTVARVESRAVDIVIRTGGSSLIVAVGALLERRFPGKVVEHDPFTSVAGGLAIANYHGYT